MDAERIEALAKLAYERWVEAQDGVFVTALGPVGLPPWLNRQNPEDELSGEEKYAWGEVAIAVAGAVLNDFVTRQSGPETATRESGR